MAQTEVECTFRAPEQTQADLVDQAQGRGKRSVPKKKTAAEKVGGDDDPFKGSDLARGAENGPNDDETDEQPEDAEQAE
ncbi:MAG TPA: hypothetical protein VL598_13325 [Trinickia sp.]|jgi:hypothetical protein|uniref:hypothetical protein n=1 Tax=Trinickia sp. TaxID=2571163 RepID=UPI002C448066|nr:hypothetical protein [Trinickia sp.]HTI18641.1 hypothetical protein [Trinickia sp.]